jgi:hypothetical protein
MNKVIVIICLITIFCLLARECCSIEKLPKDHPACQDDYHLAAFVAKQERPFVIYKCEK